MSEIPNFFQQQFCPFGKTHLRILGLQPEFCRKGVWGMKRLAKWVLAVLPNQNSSVPGQCETLVVQFVVINC